MNNFIGLSIDLIGGVEGDCLCIQSWEDKEKTSGVGTRIAGPKPWGGGSTKKSWDIGLDSAEGMLEEIYRVYPDAKPKIDYRPKPAPEWQHASVNYTGHDYEACPICGKAHRSSACSPQPAPAPALTSDDDGLTLEETRRIDAIFAGTPEPPTEPEDAQGEAWLHEALKKLYERARRDEAYGEYDRRQDWIDSAMGTIALTYPALRAALAASKEEARGLRKALKPFAFVGRKIPDNWRGDMPLKNQVGVGKLPLVSDYRNAARAALNKDKQNAD